MATRDEWAACAAAGMPATTVTLPWPHKGLSPNARLHWAELARLKRAARARASWECLAAGVRDIDATRVTVRVTFCPPDRRARDRDNMIASCKAAFDGIADVIGVDDAHWEITFAIGALVKGGSVVVEIAAP